MGDEARAIGNAVESVSKRCHSASWLQRMIGPLDLPIDPSEEDLRLCLRDGNVLCRLISKVDPALMFKVLEAEEFGSNTSPSQDSSLRRFLKAVSLVKLPSFEALDLEQPNYQQLSLERVVDCLLSLKSYHEWALGKQHTPKKNEGASVLNNEDSPSPSSMKSYSHHASSAAKSPIQSRKRWVLPEQEIIGEGDMHELQEFLSTGGSPQPRHTLHKFSSWERTAADENFVPTSPQTGLTSTQIHHITQKFREILRLKTRGSMQDSTASQNKGVLNSLENSPSQSESSLVNAMLGDKQHEDVSTLVELMLKKVMEEFERRLITQKEQVANLKSTLREHLTREDRLVSRARVLETLAAGTGEEVKIVHTQLQKMKLDKEKTEEELRSKELLMSKLAEEKRSGQALLESLERQLQEVKHKDQQHIKQLELQKQELKQEMQNKLETLEALQQESNQKMHELQACSAAEMEALNKREQQYQDFLLSQRKAFEDIKLVVQATKLDFLTMQSAWHEESEALGVQLQGLAEAASGYHKVLAENRQLYNEVQDLKGNIRVYCRVRPFLPGQSVRQNAVEFVGENGDLLIANPLKQGKEGLKMFNFNKSFRPSATQEEVFLDTRPLIRSVLDGYNVCIFAYGQTGSGKTFTMTGPSSLSEKDWGVNYRALNDLFHISQSREDVFKYEVGVQMVEIYNEQVRDLLLIEGSNKRLEIRNHSQLNGLNVPDASMLPVNSTADVLELIKIGQKNRAVGATALNERSSRSHSVLTVHVQGTDLASGSILRGCLHLVDLAGSERVDRSEATGDRLKEAQHINKSLSALGDVVSALAQKSTHVPYRNSKLTQLLQNSLAGQAKTLMFVHISPDMESYGETMSTLKFAERVASVELGAARSNKESREVRDLKEQVNALREIIAKKDGEIDRLQSVRGTTIEDMPVERSKTRPERGLHFHKPPPVQMKQTKLRRQTVDLGGHKEKWLAGRQFLGSHSQDLDTFSPPTSPKESKRLQDGLVKEKFLDSKKQKSNSFDCKVGENRAELRHDNQKGKGEADHATAEFKPKDWQDRVQSSTDSSLFGTSSVDDLSSMSDGAQTWQPDRQALASDSVDFSNIQAKAPHDSFLTNLSKVDRGVGSGKVDVEARNLRTLAEAERPHAGELDTSSDNSDGYVSQADTEVSLSGTIEQSVFTRKEQRASSDQRKPPQPQMTRSLRGEWKSLNLGQSHSRAKQQLVSSSPSLAFENTASKKQTILGAKHVADVSGHRGIGAIAKAVETFFYWPTLRGDVDAFMRACIICEKVKFDRQKEPGLLQPLPILDKPWESIAMDFIFDLPRIQTRSDGIWTIGCRFSKQAHFIPVRKKIKPDQMAHLFMSNIFKYHGMPQSIVSDRDPRMTSLFWRGLFENMGLTLKFSSSFHPQTDGLKLPENWKIHNAFHVSLLRLYVCDVPKNMPVEEPPEVEELDETLVPEQILAHKETNVKGKVARRYLVKFRNYSPMDAKWMEEGELAEPPNVL
ncbi:hypothetical protein L7F22_017722 [Adiantum nelumboides]|nr:hypothetical protein [Adiantum nelumboides]